MAATALIVFREVFEAALIVSIVLAATLGVAGRGRWVTAGVATGLGGAAVLAVLAGEVASAAAGMGQEYLNATILFAAVVMLGWHNVWMTRHARELKGRISALGEAVTTGARPLYAVAIVVGLAVLREGSEVVLFLYGIAVAGTSQSAEMLAGGVLGLAGGVAIGVALYFGLLRIPTRHLFVITGGLILFLAAGLAAQGAGYLVQADTLPPLGRALWDTSHILSEQSIVGQALHTLVGYIARPAGVQLLFYFVTLVVIGGLMRLLRPGSARSQTVPALFVLGTAAAALAFAAASREAHAADQVYLPFVEKGAIELEHRCHVDFDNISSKDKNQNSRFSVGYGVTDHF
jgi:high-affinity iron transporter